MHLAVQHHGWVIWLLPAKPPTALFRTSFAQGEVLNLPAPSRFTTLRRLRYQKIKPLPMVTCTTMTLHSTITQCISPQVYRPAPNTLSDWPRVYGHIPATRYSAVVYRGFLNTRISISLRKIYWWHSGVSPGFSYASLSSLRGFEVSLLTPYYTPFLDPFYIAFELL